MASVNARRKAKAEALNEEQRRQEERRQFKAAQELESLRRTFKRINKRGDGKICTQDLVEELDFLGHRITEKEAALTIWEVDDDNDGCVDWDEFKTMFYRVRDDESGCEPRKLFNVVDFLMLDKNHSGSVDMDECVTLLYARYGKEQVETNLKQMKAENHKSLMVDAANEKNVNFSFFSEIHRRCKKNLIGTGIKQGATTVPQVNGLKFVNDPQFQHLIS
jgi:calmodulin